MSALALGLLRRVAEGDGRREMSRRREDDALVPGDDGFPARIVGPWVARKAYFVDRYAQMFATGMKNQWPQRAYVELFAGPGRSWEAESGRFVPGSPLRSFDREFTDRAFIEMNPEVAAALDQRIRARGATAPVFVGDCNDKIGDLIAAVPPRALTLAFVDPTNWQVRFETIAALVTARKVDLMVSFMYGAMKRVETADPPALTAFFGTPAWKDCLSGARWEVLDDLASLYNAQLEQFGYLPSFRRREIVKNGKNVAMYALILFSRDPRGVEFWGKAIGGPTETGQNRLPGVLARRRPARASPQAPAIHPKSGRQARARQPSAFDRPTA